MDRLNKTTALLVCLLFTGIALAGNGLQPKYLDAVKQELARLGMEAACHSSSGTCTIADPGEGRTLNNPLKIVLNDQTSTAYIYLENFLLLEADKKPSPELYRRLLELNGQMVSSRLELHTDTNEIRLSAIMNTDSNFDRKAFRSIVLGLITTARKLRSELSNMGGEIKSD